MARRFVTTVRPDREDVEALVRARRDGVRASELMRKDLRIGAARYNRNHRPPSTRLFVSTDVKLGNEKELFRDVER